MTITKLFYELRRTLLRRHARKDWSRSARKRRARASEADGERLRRLMGGASRRRDDHNNWDSDRRRRRRSKSGNDERLSEENERMRTVSQVQKASLTLEVSSTLG